MAGEFIYKPETRKGPVFIDPNKESSSPPQIKLPDGRVITAVRGDQAGGTFDGHEGRQWVFPKDVLGQEGATLIYNGKQQSLGNTNMSYRGNSVGSLSESMKGAIGSGSGSSGINSGFTPGQIGEYGVAPAYIGDLFPDPTLIEGAAKNYTFVDPVKFGESYNPFQRNEISKNFTQAGDFALQAIEQEFKGIESFVPRSARIGREQANLDNTSNQQRRTDQVNAAVPDVVKDLNDQAGRARTYASGRLPDDVANSSLELTVRSEAADAAAAGGFGVRSSASRKVSDLMSARERLGIAQYGEGLTAQNAKAREDLLLAPTIYTNAGAQVQINPTSGAQLTQQNLSDINAQTLLSAGTAFQGEINQFQFGSNLEQRTQEFNATNQNNFALSFFNYLNSYANSVAGAASTNINTGVAIDQQNRARDEANKHKGKTQKGNAISDTISAVGSVAGAIGGVFKGGF